MYIAHKSNTILSFHGLEWECRRMAKELATHNYWPWLKTVTSTDSDGNETYDFSGESYTIVECNDEDVQTRLVQLDDYVSNKPGELIYNIKYYASKRDAEEILDIDDKSHDPKQYVQSHFIPDNSSKDARVLADKWANVRRDRDRKLAETDYLALSDNTLSSGMETYRQELRDVPTQSDPDNITWPDKP